jgi:hypothetical protein
MSSYESKAIEDIDKFNRGYFKIKLLLASMNLWDIVDRSKETPPSNEDPKLFKKYQRCFEKAMSIIGHNMADYQLMHIKSCKGSTKA